MREVSKGVQEALSIARQINWQGEVRQLERQLADCQTEKVRLQEALRHLAICLPDSVLDEAADGVGWGNTNANVVRHWRDKALVLLNEGKGEVKA